MHLNPTQNSFSYLIQLFGNKQEGLSVLHKLSTQIQNSIPLLQNSIADFDFEKTGSALHQLRSELGICGYQELSEQAGDMERICRFKQTGALHLATELLIEQFEKTIREIDDLCIKRQ